MLPEPRPHANAATTRAHAGGSLLPYELDESHGWALDLDSLRGAVKKARAEGKNVRGLVFINPGNPTGQCLSYDNLKVCVCVCVCVCLCVCVCARARACV
jgi:aspartate/methionine/tyrosine aminotransferase